LVYLLRAKNGGGVLVDSVLTVVGNKIRIIMVKTHKDLMMVAVATLSSVSSVKAW
jgi:hypothetical protein